MDININDFFNEDGSVNPDGPGLLSLAGEEYTKSQVFKDVKDIRGLVKMTADTKHMTGSLEEKLKKAIVKPADDAPEEEKAKYVNSLREALGGMVKSGAEYEFARPKMPEGVDYPEEIEASMRQLFAENHVPKDVAAVLYGAYINGMIADHNARMKAQTEQFNTDVEKIRTDWQGNALTEKARQAYNFYMAYGSDDTKAEDGTVVKGLKTILKESGVYDSPGDFEKWKAAGITPDQIRFAAAVGKDMRAGTIIHDEGAGPGGLSPEEQANKDFINQVNAGSPGMQV